MNAVQAFVPSEVVKTFAAFLEFYYIARRDVITEDSLDQLNTALRKFHEARQVFSGTVQAEGPSAFSLPRQHAMIHYYDHIKNFGAPNGLCSSITESKHIAAVKRPWRRSNRHAPLSQMLKSNERIDKLAAARADFMARGMLADSCFIEAIKNALSTMDHDEDSVDEDASDSDETDSDVFDEDFANTQDFSTITSTFDNSNTHGLKTNDTEIDTPDNADAHIFNTGDDHPSTPRLPSPVPFDDSEDDCGPIESGPLMNEVRLVSKKGKKR